MKTHARGQNTRHYSLHTKSLVRAAILLSFFAGVLFFGMQVEPALAAPSPTGATIASDQADYPPGAIVTLTGAGWANGEAVHIFVNDDGGQTWSHSSSPDPVADTNGNFIYTLQLPTWFVANYSVTATGATSGTATTTFTDVAIGTYDQCSNDTGSGYTTGDTGCRWINGNLQGNNSKYVEGDATVQRVWLTDFVPGSSHTVTFKYGTTKGGKHAYDFLTTFNYSETWITDADRCESITGCTSATDSTFAIPQDPLAGGFDNFVRNFTIRGGTITAVSTPTIFSGAYSGDSETVITVSFTVAGSGSMCEIKQQTTTCGVAIWFGAHVATQANWGTGTGAGSISGSPYHVALSAIDGAAVGQRDNQMQADAVTSTPNGTIVIVKNAIPDDPQDFAFNLTNGSTINQNFTLDDDSDPTLPNSQTFSVPPGTWTATEGSAVGNWILSDISCADPTNNSLGNEATRTATIDLASNETVTCTFENTLAPQSVYLASFKAALRNNKVKLKWSTANELNVLGFNVWRSRSRNGTYTQLNAALLNALHVGELTGDKYTFTDRSAKPGKTYYYKIEVVGADGTLEVSEIVRVNVPAVR